MICRLAVLIDERNAQLSESGQTSQRLSQRKLAEHVGIATTTLNRLYNNSFERVDSNTVEKLCHFFECEVGDLFVLKEAAE